MASGIVNIGKDARGDMFHRYKMPVLQVKVEGKGNGIKTVIPNISDIARALARPASYPTKFFGCELGAQTMFDEKADRYIINGAHQADRLRELLDVFIEKFVLCDACKNPETDLVIRDKLIYRDCKACGHRGLVDNRHKLCVFVIKTTSEPKKKKKDKSNKIEGGAEATSPNVNGDESTMDQSAQDELTKRIESEAVTVKVAEATSELANEGWSEDTSSEAVKARLRSLESGMQNGLLLDDDEEESGGGPHVQFEEWIISNRETVTDVEILTKAKELGIDQKHRTVQILARALFTENAVKEVEKHQTVFVKMVTSEKHQKSLLGGIEKLCGETYPSLVPNGVPKIIAEFYKIDVLDEEVIKQWGTHVSSKYVDKEISKKVRRASEPLLKWLDEASEEESE